MNFCWSTLNVINMEESLKFYEEVIGLTLNKRYKAGPGMEIAFLGSGDTKVELISNEAVKEVNMGKDISLGFETESVDKLMDILNERGIAIEAGPFQPNPFVKFFFIKDPNGLKIQFVENIK